nr:MAG TPA: hypothetical protein [Caudoviricetes sp.]
MLSKRFPSNAVQRYEHIFIPTNFYSRNFFN